MEDTKKAKRILLVEDSVITQDILRLALTASGHNLSIANTVKEAVKFLNDELYDIALIDFHLPDGNGYELVREYFRTSSHALTPRLVALSANVSEVIAVDKAAHHFDLVMAKPFMISDLIDVIESSKSKPHPKDERETVLSKEQQKPKPVFGDPQNFHLIYFPFDFRSSFKNAISMSIAQNGPVDAIIFDKIPDNDDAIMLTKIKGLGTAAHIDRTGKLKFKSDYGIDEDAYEDELIQFLDFRRERRNKLHPSHHLSKTLEENTLLSVYLKNEMMLPRIDFSDQFGVSYNHILSGEVFYQIAERLVAENTFLNAPYLEVIRCPLCESARLYPQNLNSDEPIPDEIFCTDCRKNIPKFIILKMNMSKYEPSRNAIETLMNTQKEMEFIA